MEQYQKEKYMKELNQQEKENIFKDIYSCIKSFNTLLYEAIKNGKK